MKQEFYYLLVFFLIYCTFCSLHFCLFLGESHP